MFPFYVIIIAVCLWIDNYINIKDICCHCIAQHFLLDRKDIAMFERLEAMLFVA